MGQGGVGGQGAAQSPSKEMQLWGWGVFPAAVQADAEQHHQLYVISLSNM